MFNISIFFNMHRLCKCPLKLMPLSSDFGPVLTCPSTTLVPRVNFLTRAILRPCVPLRTGDFDLCLVVTFSVRVAENDMRALLACLILRPSSTHMYRPSSFDSKP